MLWSVYHHRILTLTTSEKWLFLDFIWILVWLVNINKSDVVIYEFVELGIVTRDNYSNRWHIGNIFDLAADELL